MRWFIICLLALPFLELWLLLKLGEWIGATEMFIWILLTGVLGFWFARKQGARIWREVQEQIRSGQPPGYKLLDGLCVLLGGVMLVVPGVLTDLLGLTLLLPLTRPFYRALLLKWLERKMRGGGGGGNIIIRRF